MMLQRISDCTSTYLSFHETSEICEYLCVSKSADFFFHIYDLRHISLHESCFYIHNSILALGTHFAYSAYPACAVQGKTMFLIVLKLQLYLV